MPTANYTGKCPYKDCKGIITIPSSSAHAHNVVGCMDCARVSIIVAVNDATATVELSAVQ